ncbi:MAG: COR domain-containing protein [Thiofilum sp.]|uniref:COR domain-containing protein n=1 Tax=Thiofilum sp. TaxID=2212733 RepID=UPI003BB0E5FD
MSEEALRRIQEEKKERTGKLDLINCDLAEIPQEIGELLWLETLNISFNRNLYDLLPLKSLSQLQKLYCFDTSVSDLTPIQCLSQLQELDCSNTKITDLSPIQYLSQLKTLHCSNNDIRDLTPIQNLSQLQALYCSNNDIRDFTPIKNLTELKLFSCYSTQVTDLSVLKNLDQLAYLNISETSICDLRHITHLLKEDITLCYNACANYEKLINVSNCPLITPPVEFAKEGRESVLEYFEQIETNAQNLNELKIIFLGEGAAGKTSLIKRIRQESFDPKESQTHGIRIQKTTFQLEDENINAHLWDFGGQEVMHATHQFFLSQRCIYVLVLDSRKDEKAEYWLKHANSFGGNSPVLIVLNKMDENPSFEVNRKVLNEKYSQIKGYFKLSCKNDEGITEFISALKDQMSQAPARRTPFPSTWLAVKEHFTNMQQDYIDSCEYQSICLQHGVDKPFSQSVLLQFLHDLGLVINFRNLKAFDTQILNPIWLTNGVYRIINSKHIVEHKGIVCESELDSIINDACYQAGNTSDQHFHYPKAKLLYIIRVMQEFELCFPLNQQTYVIPQLLPINEPDSNFTGSIIHFTVEFPELLPDSIFPRLMVKLHDFIKGDLRWRTGMVLYKPIIFKAQARVRIDREEKRINIDAYGAEPRRLLSFIRETLKDIINDFTDLPFEEQVPIPNSNILWSYSELVDLEAMGDEEFSVGKLKKRFSIADLLDGIEEPQMRDQVAQTPVTAFVSYAHKDAKHLGNMLSAFSPLVRLNKLKLWADIHIDAGVEWEPKIMQQLNEADIVLCLVSADFINSDFCYKREFEQALEAHKAGTKIVVPIRLRTCSYQDLALSTLQGIPKNWITSSANEDEAWTEAADMLRIVIETTQQRLKKRTDSAF